MSLILASLTDNKPRDCWELGLVGLNISTWRRPDNRAEKPHLSDQVRIDIIFYGLGRVGLLDPALLPHSVLRHRGISNRKPIRDVHCAHGLLSNLTSTNGSNTCLR